LRAVTAGVDLRLLTLLSSVIALAASNITISALWCRQLSVIIPSAIDEVDVVDEFDK